MLMIRSATIAAVLLGALAGRVTATVDDPILVIHGEPYATGEITLSVAAPVAYEGSPVGLILGFNPLPLLSPLSTSKGPFWVGTITHVKLVGTMPVGSPFHLDAVMPDVVPGAEGLYLAVQMLLPGRLTNAATLPLDAPYFLPAEAAQIVAVEPEFAARFGDQHAVGDFNGDGVPDIAVGAWQEDGAFDKEGRVHVRWGPDFAASTELASPTPGVRHYFGFGLTAVDLDGDGIDDLVVSEGSGYPDQPADPGRLWIFKGSVDFSTDPAQEVTGTAQEAEAVFFGRLTSAGDYNDDGAIDLVATVPDAHAFGLERAGRLDVFWGPSFSDSSPIFGPDPSELSFFGSGLTTADVNGDGIDDIVEASSRDNYNGIDNLGRVHVFTGPDLTSYATIDNPLPMGFNSRFGNFVAAADFNGDGADEIVTTDQHGHGYIFWSTDFEQYHLLNQPPSTSGPSASFGYFAAVGDVNGDGAMDVALSAPFAEGIGAVYVYLGPHFGSAHVVQEAIPGPLSEFGWFISLVDVDDDGCAELLSGNDVAEVGGLLGAGRLTVSGMGGGG